MLQTDFLFELFETMMQREPTSFLELGCGPAHHSFEMADSMLDVYAVDTNRAMLAHAEGIKKQLERGDAFSLQLIEADMRSFQMPVRCSSGALPARRVHHCRAVARHLACKMCAPVVGHMPCVLPVPVALQSAMHWLWDTCVLSRLSVRHRSRYVGHVAHS